MSEWLKEMRCKRIGYAYAGSNPAPPTDRTCKAGCQAQLAQLVEHLHGKEGVVGSSPTLGSQLAKARGRAGVGAVALPSSSSLPRWTSTSSRARTTVGSNWVPAQLRTS